MSRFTDLRIGVSLCGISYGVKQRDWRRDFDNIQENLIHPLNASVYITTYPNETTDDMISRYNPVKFQLLEFQNSDLRLTYRKSLEMLKTENLDLIITTRCDMLFNSSVSDWNIDLDRFNFLFKERGWWEPYQYTADPQYFSAFHPRYIDPLIVAVQDVYDRPHRHDCPDLHPAYSRLEPIIGAENINFLFDIETLSHDNHIVRLDRIP